jgi:hypothetical protein
MVDEMLVAQRQWLPNFAKGDIDAAADRLAARERDGTRVETRSWRGAARKEARTVEELHEQKDEGVLSQDKAASNRAARLIA